MKPKSKRLSSTLLRSIFIYSITILVCFSGVFIALFYLSYEHSEERRVLAITEDAAALLDGKNTEEDVRILENQLETGIRYTLVSPDGNVIFDSKGSGDENHANRPEIVEARETGASAITRYSSTLGKDTVYAAILLDSGNVLRLSEQRASFVSIFKSTAPALFIALAVVFVLSIAISRLLANRIVAPLNKVNISSPLDSETYEEMRPLLARMETQQKQLMNQNSELARAENMRREFSANVSHEMKTPLQVISGYAELLARGNIPEKDAEKFARIILSESENMTSLINDVLVLSRIDDPVLENAAKEEVDLLALSHEIAARFSPLAEKRSVSIRCLGSPVIVDGNRGLLDQLVSNLVSNAVKYSHPGGEVIISIGKNLVAPDAAESPTAYIRVRDNGCGIPAEELDKIFERFYRVDKSRSKESGGTGLGLAIAKHAAAIHDATIAVESSVGRGSVFTVRIPTEH